MYLALYLTTPPGMIIIIILWVVILWKLPCLAFTKYVSGIQMRSITVLLRNMVLLSPWSSRSSVHSCRKKMSNKKSLLQHQQQSQTWSTIKTWLSRLLLWSKFFLHKHFQITKLFPSVGTAVEAMKAHALPSPSFPPLPAKDKKNGQNCFNLLG